MYRFKKEKYKELLKCNTVEYLSKLVGYTATTLYYLLNGHTTCKKPLAYMIVKVMDERNEIEDFFDKVKGDNEEC